MIQITNSFPRLNCFFMFLLLLLSLLSCSLKKYFFVGKLINIFFYGFWCFSHILKTPTHSEIILKFPPIFSQFF